MEMNVKSLISATVMVLLFGGVALAQNWSNNGIASKPSPAMSEKLKSITGTIKGSMAAPTSGQCTNGYSDQCPSGSNCHCVVYSGRLSSSIGTSSNVEIDMTVDEGNPIGFADACFPYYAEVTLNASKDPTETWALQGAMCESFGNKFPVTGGWGLTGSSVFAPGVGTLNGTQDNFLGAGNFNFHFQGKGCTNCI
jgi:hypothetical protein